jgi:hypothetical protein
MKKIFTACLCLCLVAPISLAKQILVSQRGGGNFTKIQAAINAAANGDTVVVRPGVYVENLNFKGKKILVTSALGPDSTIVDGGRPSDSNIGSVVSFVSGEDSTAILKGFTIMKGTGTLIPFAGGIRIGGGILCDGASPTIWGNIIRDNKADDGAGIECTQGANAKVFYNLIWRNVASTTNPNFISSGGGMTSAFGSRPQVINNTIVGNECLTGGGGVSALFPGTNPVLRNNIIFNNRGGGIFAEVGAQVTVSYCDVFSNPSTTLGDYHNASCGAGCISAFPNFVDAVNGNFRLLANSPCIDAGDPSEKDPDGTRRDIGAFIFDIRTAVAASPNTPLEYQLMQNYPNPFWSAAPSRFAGNPETAIRFVVPWSSHVDVTIYNMRGEKVRQLVSTDYAAGAYVLNWDGRDEVRRNVASGVYLYQIRANGFVAARRMLLLR